VWSAYYLTLTNRQLTAGWLRAAVSRRKLVNELLYEVHERSGFRACSGLIAESTCWAPDINQYWLTIYYTNAHTRIKVSTTYSERQTLRIRRKHVNAITMNAYCFNSTCSAMETSTINAQMDFQVVNNYSNKNHQCVDNMHRDIWKPVDDAVDYTQTHITALSYNRLAFVYFNSTCSSRRRINAADVRQLHRMTRPIYLRDISICMEINHIAWPTASQLSSANSKNRSSKKTEPCSMLLQTPSTSVL